MTESSTDINELPIDPGISQSNNNNNIVIETKEKNIADSVLQASTLGLTSLPARDMPRTTVNHSHDLETTPNHVPTGAQEDYIKNHGDEKGLLMNLADDLYITLQSLTHRNGLHYIVARQTSQGRQRAYNPVGVNELPE